MNVIVRKVKNWILMDMLILRKGRVGTINEMFVLIIIKYLPLYEHAVYIIKIKMYFSTSYMVLEQKMLLWQY